MKKYFVLFYVGVVSSPAFAQTKMLTEDSLRWESFRREQQVIQQAAQVDFKYCKEIF